MLGFRSYLDPREGEKSNYEMKENAFRRFGELPSNDAGRYVLKMRNGWPSDKFRILSEQLMGDGLPGASKCMLI